MKRDRERRETEGWPGEKGTAREALKGFPFGPDPRDPCAGSGSTEDVSGQPAAVCGSLPPCFDTSSASVYRQTRGASGWQPLALTDGPPTPSIVSEAMLRQHSFFFFFLLSLLAVLSRDRSTCMLTSGSASRDQIFPSGVLKTARQPSRWGSSTRPPAHREATSHLI